MAILVTGDKELDRVLATLESGVEKKIMRPAIGAGLRVAVKAMKAAVPANMKDAKKAIGSRFGKSPRTGTVMAKAGAGVGMKAAKIAKQAAKQSQKRGGRPGVGIGARNIHWFILGTAERTTGTKRTGSHKAGAVSPLKFTGGAVHSTGKMPPQMDPVREGFERSEASVMQKIIETARSKLAVMMRGGP